MVWRGAMTARTGPVPAAAGGPCQNAADSRAPARCSIVPVARSAEVGSVSVFAAGTYGAGACGRPRKSSSSIEVAPLVGSRVHRPADGIERHEERVGRLPQELRVAAVQGFVVLEGCRAADELGRVAVAVVVRVDVRMCRFQDGEMAHVR